jgi:hypothetical protein
VSQSWKSAAQQRTFLSFTSNCESHWRTAQLYLAVENIDSADASAALSTSNPSMLDPITPVLSAACYRCIVVV